MTKNSKLKKKLTKFLMKYNWSSSEMVEDGGIGEGYFFEKDKPKVVKEVDELFKEIDA
jgi:hypothetical protein|tara:strand:- start:142 stop:315 length:174 start_codon:yes stop_codon:yes gene_type:complete